MKCAHGFYNAGFCPTCTPSMMNKASEPALALGTKPLNHTGERPNERWGSRVLFKLEEDAKTPTKSYDGDAGFDLYTHREIVVEGFGKGRASYDVPTGLFLALPQGYWGHIVARSSTFRRYGLHIISAVIDNGYRGEMFIQAVNPNPNPTILPKHTRIAQLILHKIYEVQWEQVKELPTTERQGNGFGSSGT